MQTSKMTACRKMMTRKPRKTRYRKLDELTTGKYCVSCPVPELLPILLQYYRTGDLVTAAKTMVDAN